MDKIGPIFLEKEEANILLEAIEKIIEEQEEIRKKSTAKIAACFSIQNSLRKNESKSD